MADLLKVMILILNLEGKIPIPIHIPNLIANPNTILKQPLNKPKHMPNLKDHIILNIKYLFLQ